MTSCLICSKWIDLKRWTCEKCDKKAITVYERSIKKNKDEGE